ncbi:MAG TPA: dihydroorotate dehydrogenase electron transfer subunit [Bacillota bacterium]|nr:dihydroorotate dehydrogenase electron transfer subunit [Bacillota bacterium]
MNLEQARVVENRLLAPGHRRMVLHAPAIAAAAGPGQFVHLRAHDSFHPLLRRPLSVARCDRSAGTLVLIYRVIGEGTTRLADRRPGDWIDLLGPLGRGFRLAPGLTPLLVAGGVGVAPLIFLAEECVRKGRAVEVLAGARSASLLVGEEDLRELGVKCCPATDDGSRGYRGPVTGLLEGRLDGRALYASGPPGMLRQVQQLAGEVPAQLCIEATMACGVGACRGCACRARGGAHRLVCTDGPVFDSHEVTFDG